MLKFKYFIIALFLLGTIYNLKAQEIKATVFVDVQQLSQEARTNVSSLDQDLMRYINNQSFTGNEWKGEKIPVDITIYLSGGGGSRYSAQLFIISRRILDSPDNNNLGQSVTFRNRDQNWHFTYGLGAVFNYNPLRFDEFVSLIDYYMLMVIGYDMDTYGELDGSPAFEKAKNIFLLGSSNQAEGYQTYSEPGAYTRYNLINDLTDPRYEDFRKLIFSYYVDGLDKMAFKKDEATAKLADVIADMANFKQKKMGGSSVFVQIFFETKAQELATIFNGYPDRQLFKNLIYLDPSNTQLYEDAKAGRMK